jgi:hypothetical protein
LYTTRFRYGDVKTFTGAGVYAGAFNISYQYANFLEGVYSWRTGAGNVSDAGQSPPLRQRNQDEWGLITPVKSGSLATHLASRKKYLEDFARMMVPAQTATGAESTTRASTTDTGHPFGSIKVLRSHISLDAYLNNGASWYRGPVFVSHGKVANATPYSYGPLAANTASLLSITPTNRQATANRYFAMTAPDRKIGSLGSTLIELIRGDVPSLLKNFQEMMAAYKNVRNYAGAEALNIMFGWTPLIQEWANIIKVGMGLERVIYYESFRRKRQWDGPTYSASGSASSFLSYLGTPYAQFPTLGLPGETTGGSSGLGGSIAATQFRDTAVEDYHFTSKYTGLAKAGRRAESFSDQAMDVAKRMGVIDDPEMIWDLTPYSWLVDWFTTMGESIANANVYSPLSGKYNVDYAYVTTRQTTSYERTLLRVPSAGWVRSLSVTSARGEQITVAKWRDRATPFGFGTQLGSLSASQFAILVALGFAKTR